MRNALLAVLAIASVVLLYVGLRSGDPSSPAPGANTHVHVPSTRSATAATTEEVRANTRAIDRDHPGYAVYSKRGCNVCHGQDLGGTNMAPGLLDIAEHWTPESFGRYLANPDSSVRVDERLQELDARYGMFVMPSYDLEEEDLQALTTLILGS